VKLPKEEKDPDDKKKYAPSEPSTKQYISRGINKLNMLIAKAKQDKSNYTGLQRTLVTIGGKLKDAHPEMVNDIKNAVTDVSRITKEEEEHVAVFQTFIDLLNEIQTNIDEAEKEEAVERELIRKQREQEREEEGFDSIHFSFKKK
jgi:hypothetical protein